MDGTRAQRWMVMVRTAAADHMLVPAVRCGKSHGTQNGAHGTRRETPVAGELDCVERMGGARLLCVTHRRGGKRSTKAVDGDNGHDVSREKH